MSEGRPSFEQLGLDSELRELEAIKGGLLRVAENQEISGKFTPYDKGQNRRKLRDHFNDYAVALNDGGNHVIEKESLENHYLNLFKTPGNLRTLADAYKEHQEDPKLKAEVERLREKWDKEDHDRGGTMKSNEYDAIDTYNLNFGLIQFLNELADRTEAENIQATQKKRGEAFFTEVKKQVDDEAYEIFRTEDIEDEDEKKWSLESLLETVVKTYARTDIPRWEKNQLTEEHIKLIKDHYKEKLSATQRRIIADRYVEAEKEAYVALTKATAEFGTQERTDEEKAEYAKKQRGYYLASKLASAALKLL